METIRKGKYIYCYSIEEPREALLLKAINDLKASCPYTATHVYEVAINTVTKECKIKYLGEEGDYDRVLFLVVGSEKLRATVEKYRNKPQDDNNLYYQNIDAKDAPLTTSLINKVSGYKPIAIDLIKINLTLKLMEIAYVTNIQKQPKRVLIKLTKAFIFSPDPFLKELVKAHEHTKPLVETEDQEVICLNFPKLPINSLQTKLTNYRFINKQYAN